MRKSLLFILAVCGALLATAPLHAQTQDTVTSCEMFLPFSTATLAGDMSGNGYDGTLGGGAAFDAATGSYTFASSGRITCGTFAWGSAWTIGGRCSWDGTTTGAMTLISKCDTVSDADMVAYVWYSSTADRLYVSTTDNSAFVAWNPTSGVIYDVYVTYSGGTATFYVDGTAIGTAAFTPGTDQTASVNVGAATAGGVAPWLGNIYHAYVASRALTANQIAALTDSEPDLPSVDVLLQRDFIGFWPMDDVAGTTHSVFDHATGRHVVNTGMTVGDDWLEGTGTADLYTNYLFMDDLTSGRPQTVYAEVYHPAWDSTVQSLAAAMDDDATSDRCWALTLNSTAASLLYSANGTSQSTLSTSNAPTSAAWNRALTSYDGTTVRVGLNNGATIAQNSATSALSAPFINFRIGSYHNGTARQYLSSGVRERNVMAWARGLSEVERLHVLAGNFSPARLEGGIINVALLVGQSNQIGHQTINTDAVTGNVPKPGGTYFGLTPGVWVNEINQTPTGFRRAFPRDGETMLWLGPQTGAASVLGKGWVIINGSVGASGIAPEWNQWITSWEPTVKASYYNNAEAHYAKAIASLVAAGFTPKLRVIDVHFGENDGNLTEAVADDYEDNLTRFIAQLRTDFGDVPINLPRLSIHQTTVPYLAEIRTATEAVAAAGDRITLMDLDDYDLVGGNDRIHFTNEAQWWIGRAKAKNWLEVLAGSEQVLLAIEDTATLEEQSDYFLNSAVPYSNDPNTIADCLNAARAQAIGKWVLNATTKELTIYSADGTTPIVTLDIGPSLNTPLTRTPQED